MQAEIITDERYQLTVIGEDGSATVYDASRYDLAVTEEVALVVKLAGVIAVTALNGSSHDHDNKAVLDQFGESNGQPTYNNQIIYTQPAIIDGGTF